MNIYEKSDDYVISASGQLEIKNPWLFDSIDDLLTFITAGLSCNECLITDL